jgi:NAD(P)H-nitrite reductase large subunit
MSYIIIGNSTAAVGTIEGIRKYDNKTSVTVVSDEPYHTYSRPLISYYLGGKVSEGNMIYRSMDFYEKNNVKAILGVKVDSVNFTEKSIHLENGEKLDFSKLLIATGGKPFIPPMGGLGKKNIFNFIKFDDVKAIEKVAVTGAKAVVIGASFSGLKAVEALVKRGVDVTVIDIMSRIIPRVLDDTAAAIAEKTLEEHNVRVLLNNTVETILGDEKATGVLLKDGTQIDCDFIILAIGVRCNTDLVKETGIKINRGIVVNEKMETNISDVYAAGDVAEGYNFIEEKMMEIAIIPNAYYQGETAGANMAGADKVFNEGFIMNSMPLLDLPIISAGISEDREGLEVITRHIPDKNVYKKFYIANSKLAGYLLINDVDRAGIYTDMIRNKTDISSFRDSLGNEDFGFISLPMEIRKEKMLKGGVA